MEQILATFEVGSKGGHQKQLPEPAKPRQKVTPPSVANLCTKAVLSTYKDPSARRRGKSWMPMGNLRMAIVGQDTPARTAIAVFRAALPGMT